MTGQRPAPWSPLADRLNVDQPGHLDTELRDPGVQNEQSRIRP